MVIKKGLILIILLSLLGGCLSEDQACIQEIDERGDGDICSYMFVYYANLGSPIDEVRIRAEERIGITTLMCVKYMVDIQECRKKSHTIPAQIW